MVRVVVGPKPADRVLDAKLLSTTGVAVLLLLGENYEVVALRDRHSPWCCWRCFSLVPSWNGQR
jgi:hypothetical protein